MNRPLVGWLALGSTPASGVAGCAARPAAGATDTQPGLTAAGARDVFREARKTTPGAGVLPMISVLPAGSTPHPCPTLFGEEREFTPKGLWHSAQGCEGRATLGNRPENSTTLKGLKPPAHERLTQPRWGWGGWLITIPRVASRTRQPWAGGCNPVGVGAMAGGYLTS